MPLVPARTVADLRELRELTGDENGAQRVAWTDTWQRARDWLREKVAATGAVEEFDAAGNQWFTLGDGDRPALLLGGHIDSVPNGGWLDGCLGVLAGAEVLRALHRDGVEGAFVIPHCRWVHTIGMRFAIDVAHLDADGHVLRTVRMAPNRVGAPMRHAHTVVEAEAGAFARWGLRVGDTLEVRE